MKTLKHLMILGLLICQSTSFSQKEFKIHSLKNSEFSNKFLLEGKKGRIFEVVEINETKKVIVKWRNGCFSIGQVNENKPFGEWFLYDKKNRLREYLVFGSEGKCLLHQKKINKKGKIISEIKTITPCF